eukprot:403336703
MTGNNSDLLNKINAIYNGSEIQNSRNQIQTKLKDDQFLQNQHNFTQLNQENQQKNVNQTIDYGVRTTRRQNHNDSIITLRVNQNNSISGNISETSYQTQNVQNRNQYQSVKPQGLKLPQGKPVKLTNLRGVSNLKNAGSRNLLAIQKPVSEVRSQMSDYNSPPKLPFEREEHSESVKLLIKYNSDLKSEMDTFLEQLHGKLIRAKERKQKEIVEYNSQANSESKQREQKIKALAIQKQNIQREIDQFHQRLEELHDINKVNTLQNDLKEKSKYLQDLKSKYEFDNSIKMNEEKVLNDHQKVIDEDQSKKSKFNEQQRDAMKELRKEKRKFRVLQNLIRERHTEILKQEFESKKLIKIIRDKKNNAKSVVSTSDLESKQFRVEQAQRELQEVNLERKQKIKTFEVDYKDLEKKIKNTQYELKILELQEKDKDQQLRIMYIRQKELEKQIADYQRLQRRRMKKQVEESVVATTERSYFIKSNRSSILRQNSDQGNENSLLQTPIQVKQIENKLQEEQTGSNFFNLTQVEQLPAKVRDEDQMLIDTLNRDHEVKKQLEEKRLNELNKKNQQFLPLRIEYEVKDQANFDLIDVQRQRSPRFEDNMKENPSSFFITDEPEEALMTSRKIDNQENKQIEQNIQEIQNIELQTQPQKQASNGTYSKPSFMKKRKF